MRQKRGVDIGHVCINNPLFIIQIFSRDISNTTQPCPNPRRVGNKKNEMEVAGMDSGALVDDKKEVMVRLEDVV